MPFGKHWLFEIEFGRLQEAGEKPKMRLQKLWTGCRKGKTSFVATGWRVISRRALQKHFRPQAEKL
jgi:hypothetical protein